MEFVELCKKRNINTGVKLLSLHFLVTLKENAIFSVQVEVAFSDSENKTQCKKKIFASSTTISG